MAWKRGFRFNPTDVEIVNFYLKHKIIGDTPAVDEAINELSICHYEPKDLPKHAKMRWEWQKEWHFFTRPEITIDKTGAKTKRTTQNGFWKSTGQDREIKYKKVKIGTKKTLVFHEGRMPKGKRTDWIMHEYHYSDSSAVPANQEAGTFVLCKLFKKEDTHSIVSSDGFASDHLQTETTGEVPANDISPDFPQLGSQYPIEGTAINNDVLSLESAAPNPLDAVMQERNNEDQGISPNSFLHYDELGLSLPMLQAPNSFSHGFPAIQQPSNEFQIISSNSLHDFGGMGLGFTQSLDQNGFNNGMFNPELQYTNDFTAVQQPSSEIPGTSSDSFIDYDELDSAFRALSDQNDIFGNLHALLAMDEGEPSYLGAIGIDAEMVTNNQNQESLGDFGGDNPLLWYNCMGSMSDITGSGNCEMMIDGLSHRVSEKKERLQFVSHVPRLGYTG